MPLHALVPVWSEHRGKSLIRNHSFYFGRVRVADQCRSSQVALAFLFFGSQDVTQKRFRALDLSRPRLLEALSGAFVCF